MSSDSNADACALLHARKAGTLSTLSVELEGSPFGSVAPYCLDRRGRPLLLISTLAEHTRNLRADPRASLLVRAGGEDVQAAARLTVVGRAEPVEEGLEDAAERYYRHFPASRGHHQVHDFSFFRLEPRRLRWIGGFGDIRWIEPEEIELENPFDRHQEAAIVDHMNQDHQEAMRLYLRALAGVDVGNGDEVHMAGIDRKGCDLRTGDRLVRLAFDEPVRTPGEARERLVAMARRAREPSAVP